MRDYCKVNGRFWTGETGKSLRGHLEAQVLAAYLMTAPTSNMIGLFYLPMPTLCHETGLSEEGASKALARLSEGGFAHYDARSETVFVVNMAREQVGPSLAPADNRVKGVRREVEEHIKCPLLHKFLEVYGVAYHLLEVRPETSPFEGPSKPLRSQEKEQEQEKEQTMPTVPVGVGLVLIPDTAAPRFDFEALYQRFPRKEGKKRGLELCAKQIKSQAAYQRLSVAIANYASGVLGREPDKIKQFDTFMGCWSDYVDAGPPAVGSAPPAPVPAAHRVLPPLKRPA